MSNDRHEERQVLPGILMSQPASVWKEVEERNSRHRRVVDVSLTPEVSVDEIIEPEKESLEPVVDDPGAGSLQASNTTETLVPVPVPTSPVPSQGTDNKNEIPSPVVVAASPLATAPEESQIK